MSEYNSNPQDGEPIKRKSGLSRDQVCLKFPGFECNCPFSDEQVRKGKLKQLREELGAYSFINLLDQRLAEAYEARKRELCEGKAPGLLEKLKNFRIRIF